MTAPGSSRSVEREEPGERTNPLRMQSGLLQDWLIFEPQTGGRGGLPNFRVIR